MVGFGLGWDGYGDSSANSVQLELKLGLILVFPVHIILVYIEDKYKMHRMKHFIYK